MTPLSKTLSFENSGNAEWRGGNLKKNSLICAVTGREQGVVGSGPDLGEILLALFY